VPRIWSSAFGGNPKAATTALDLVIGRRNRIVHACDADPLAPGSVTPLTDSDTLSAISTVEATIVAIDPFC